MVWFLCICMVYIFGINRVQKITITIAVDLIHRIPVIAPQQLNGSEEACKFDLNQTHQCLIIPGT